MVSLPYAPPHPLAPESAGLKMKKGRGEEDTQAAFLFASIRSPPRVYFLAAEPKERPGTLHPLVAECPRGDGFNLAG